MELNSSPQTSMDIENLGFPAHYEKIRRIGRGTFGSCFLVRARQPTQSSSSSSLPATNLYVLKDIPLEPDSEGNPPDVRKAAREVQVLRQLDHTNVVKYVESQILADGDYGSMRLMIIMEYADGGDLQGLLDRHKRTNRMLGKDRAMYLFVQICSALRHVHSRRVVHRDLNPRNIFLTCRDIVKLGDFGISRAFSKNTQVAKTFVGTPAYLAPELCHNVPYGMPADVWACGITLHVLLSLQEPFRLQGGGIPQLLLKICDQPYIPLPASVASRAANDLMSGMLEKAPEDRPSIIQVLRTKFIQEELQLAMANSEQMSEIARLERLRYNHSTPVKNSSASRVRESNTTTEKFIVTESAERGGSEEYQTCKSELFHSCLEGQLRDDIKTLDHLTTDLSNSFDGKKSDEFGVEPAPVTSTNPYDKTTSFLLSPSPVSSPDPSDSLAYSPCTSGALVSARSTFYFAGPKVTEPPKFEYKEVDSDDEKFDPFSPSHELSRSGPLTIPKDQFSPHTSIGSSIDVQKFVDDSIKQYDLEREENPFLPKRELFRTGKSPLQDDEHVYESNAKTGNVFCQTKIQQPKVVSPQSLVKKLENEYFLDPFKPSRELGRTSLTSPNESQTQESDISSIQDTPEEKSGSLNFDGHERVSLQDIFAAAKELEIPDDDDELTEVVVPRRSYEKISTPDKHLVLLDALEATLGAKTPKSDRLTPTKQFIDLSLTDLLKTDKSVLAKSSTSSTGKQWKILSHEKKMLQEDKTSKPDKEPEVLPETPREEGMVSLASTQVVTASPMPKVVRSPSTPKDKVVERGEGKRYRFKKLISKYLVGSSAKKKKSSNAASPSVSPPSTFGQRTYALGRPVVPSEEQSTPAERERQARLVLAYERQQRALWRLRRAHRG